jgi:hypothetical protein
MKRLFTILFAFIGLFALSMLVAPTETNAQIVKSQSLVSTTNTAKTTLTAPDTAYAIYSVDYSVKSFKGYLSKTSGTVAGKVYFQGSYGDGTWDNLDSLTLSNTTTQNKLFNPGLSLIYATYRLAFITSGTSVTTPTAYYLRRN